MEAAIPEPNSLSPNAPRIISFEIDPEKIRDVIGSGGKTVRSIIQRTGVKMNIEDNGVISILGPTQAQVEDARAIVLSLTRELAAGEVYLGTVTRLLSFGAFVECIPGKEGLLHVSEISTARVPHVEDVFKVGDRVLVMVKDIDDQGRANLTRRRLMADETKIRQAGLAHVLPDERERDNLIASLSSRDRNYSAYSDRDRDRERTPNYIDRGYSRTPVRNDYGRGSAYSNYERYDRDRDRRRTDRDRRRDY